MNIPLGTEVEVKPQEGEPSRKGVITFRYVADEAVEGEPPLYTIEFEDGTEHRYFEDQFTAPEYCKCGNEMTEVSFIPGTESCFACHELYLMKETGTGVVLYDPVRRTAYLR